MSGQFGFGSAGSSPPRTTRHPDLLAHGHGSLSLLRAPSPRGQCWIDEHIAADRQEWAGAIGVEHRVILDSVRGAVADGLRVR